MKNHIVTIQTAHRLKEAGYPQPEHMSANAWQWGERILGSNDMAYMPVATEIMEQPEMEFCDISYVMNTWQAIKYSTHKSPVRISLFSDSPAEVAAEMYLKIKLGD